jgi:hypothetical protein
MKMMRSITGRKENKKIVKEWKETNLKNSENYVKNNFKSDKMKYGQRKSQFSQKRLFQRLQNNQHLSIIIIVAWQREGNIKNLG